MFRPGELNLFTLFNGGHKNNILGVSGISRW